MPAPKVIRPESISIRRFFEIHGESLGMKLEGDDEAGFEREISEPTVNRPGLALAGFYTYFAFRRIQVIGNSERSYLNNLKPEEAQERFRDLCSREIPCIVVSRGKNLTKDLLAIAREAGIAVFRTEMISMKFINAATIRLERDFAPTTKLHGCMVDVQGIGILVQGESGSGKSECVLGLIERGASLVADDLVLFRAMEGRELTGSALELGRSHMEVRGIGIVNISALFGISAIRLEKRLDLVVTLTPMDQIEDLERVGHGRKTIEILDREIPHIELPVAPGRDMAHLVEVAALDQKLKGLGHDAALEFDKKLLKIMDSKRIN
ncbi:MAG: HPr(Ser) kinase/phosphatase [Verrucomicrobiota bacterium]